MKTMNTETLTERTAHLANLISTTEYFLNNTEELSTFTKISLAIHLSLIKKGKIYDACINFPELCEMVDAEVKDPQAEDDIFDFSPFAIWRCAKNSFIRYINN